MTTEHDWLSAWRRVLRPWLSRAGFAAGFLIVVQAWWRGVLLSRSFFTQDDFLMLELGRAPVSIDMISQNYSGHLFPGGFLIAAGQARLGSLDWGLAVASVLILQVIGAVLAWLVLTQLLGERWLRLPLLAVYLFSPLTLWSTQWWAVAIQFLPVSACLLWAVWAFLVGLHDDRQIFPVQVIVAVSLALTFQERGLLIPVVIAFVATAYEPASSGPRKVLGALRRHRSLWVALAVVCVGYLFTHRALAPIASTTAGSRRSDAALVANFMTRNLNPGLWGGPWRGDVLGNSLLLPANGAVVLTGFLTLGLAWVTLKRGGSRARWGWLLLVSYALMDVSLLFAGRTAMGSAFGLIPRYAADIVPVAIVALALILGDSVRVGAAEPSARRSRALASGALTLAYAASAWLTTDVIAPYTYNESSRAFIDRIRADLQAEPGAVLYDGAVPTEVMISWFGTDGRLSTVLGGIPEAPVFDVPSPQLRLVGPDGSLHEVDFGATVTAAPSDDTACGYPITDEGAVVPLAAPVTGEGLVLRLGYYTNADGTITVTAGSSTQLVPVAKGLHIVDLVVSGEIQELEVTADAPDWVVCLTNATVGVPVLGDPT